MTSSQGQCTEVDRLAQHELHRLERSFRAMQDDRPAIPDSTRKILIKQEQLIKTLEKEKTDLTMTVHFAEAASILKAHEKATDAIRKVFVEYMDTYKTIALENKSITDVEEKIREIDREIAEVELSQNISEDSIESIKKQDTALDNLRTRLHVETVKFNQVSLDNKEIRKEIAFLLQERGRFHKIFQTLGKRLKIGRQLITDLIEQSTIAYDDRQEAKTKLRALKVKAKHDLLNHCIEMKEVLRRVELRSKLNKFVSTKGQARIAEGPEIEKNLKKTEKKQEMMRHLETYRSVIGDIVEGLGEPNVDLIVARFFKYDEDNYNIFSFINDLNKKLDGLREEVCEIEICIKQEREAEENLKKEHQTVLNDLKQEYSSSEEMLKNAKKEFESIIKASESLFKAVFDLSKTIAISNEAILQKLGRNNIVNQFNVDDYFKATEIRMINLYLACSYFAYRVPRKSYLTTKTRVSTRDMVDTLGRIGNQPCPLCAELIDISEVDETIALPLDRNELAVVLEDTVHRGLYNEVIHPVENCHLPKSRRIIQKRMN